MGHLRRCLSLAEAIRESGGDCFFITNDDAHAREWIQGTGFASEVAKGGGQWDPQDCISSTDAFLARGAQAVVVDSYDSRFEFMLGFVDAGLVVVRVDDFLRLPFPGKIYVNGSVGAEESWGIPVQKDALFLLGAEYVLLRREFRNLPRRVAGSEVRQVLVTLGGGDSWNLMPRLIEVLDGLPGDFSVSAVLGPFFLNRELVMKAASASRRSVQLVETPHSVLPLMQEADLAVSAGGQTLYELAACGTPAVAIEVAQNQREQLAAFQEKGFIRVAGTAGEPELASKLKDALIVIMRQECRSAMSHCGQNLVDGLGAPRVARCILQTVAPGRVEDLQKASSHAHRGPFR